jgi:hypothetical protein
VVNNSLAAADPTSTLLRLRAIGVLPQIDKVKKEHGTRLAMVPMLPTEPVGIPALEALNRTRVALTRWGPAMRAEGDPVDDGLRTPVDPNEPMPPVGRPKYRSGLAQAYTCSLFRWASVRNSPVTRYTSRRATETAWSANRS